MTLKHRPTTEFPKPDKVPEGPVKKMFYDILRVLFQAFRNIYDDLKTLADSAAVSAEVEDDAYGAGWNGDTTHAPSQNAAYDKIDAMDTTIGLNTTHRGSDGKDHSDVVLNNTHRTSDGTDHTYVDQDVRTSASPTFAGLTIGDAGKINWNPEPASDETATGDIATMQVDANATGIGAALHLDTDGNWIEADADTATTMPCQALAVESGTGSKKVLLRGFMRKDSWNWTVGGLIYVSTTTGALTQTAPSGSGDQVQVVGFATHADRMYFNPSLVLVEVA